MNDIEELIDRIPLFGEVLLLKREGVITDEFSERVYIVSRFDGKYPIDAVYAAINNRKN